MTSGTTLRDDQMRLGLWMFLGTVTMLFSAFASAYIVRRSGSDWQPVALPSLLWANTAVLVLSSAALEAAQRLGLRGKWDAAIAGCGAAVAGGLVFLGGQWAAWRRLTEAGVYLPTSPHSSFFFMLTGAHAVHILAALVVLMWGLAMTQRARTDPARWPARMELCRTFWHYLGGVWIFLFALLSLY